MRWVVADSLYNEEARFCGHLDSWAHYLVEAGQDASVLVIDASVTAGPVRASHVADVLFALDAYETMVEWPARLHIAQQNSLAARNQKQSWECRRPDGKPAYDLVLSAIPALVTRAREMGCNAELMPLAFDTRARACGMGVSRDLGCVFLGSAVPFIHKRRAMMLEALRDVVTVLPPAYGRDYFRTLARARAVFNVHAEWSFGAAMNMRLYEAAGMGCQVVTDGVPVTGTFGEELLTWETEEQARVRIEEALVRATTDRRLEANVLLNHMYEKRVPVLLEMVRSLP